MKLNKDDNINKKETKQIIQTYIIKYRATIHLKFNIIHKYEQNST